MPGLSEAAFGGDLLCCAVEAPAFLARYCLKLNAADLGAAVVEGAEWATAETAVDCKVEVAGGVEALASMEVEAGRFSPWESALDAKVEASEGFDAGLEVAIEALDPSLGLDSGQKRIHSVNMEKWVSLLSRAQVLSF